MSIPEILRRRKNVLLLIILIVFHTVGLIGLYSGQRAYFLSLSPFNLLLAMTCLLASFTISATLLADVVLVGLLGFAAELIGVHTGYLFGDYAYGQNLGWKWLDVPVMIAVNWAMLSYASIACVLHLKIPVWLKAVLSAALMTGLDVLIEPVAIQSDYWHWKNGVIPLYNYVCWFLVAFPLHFYLLKRRTPEQNMVAIGLFIVLAVFFGVLNLN